MQVAAVLITIGLGLGVVTILLLLLENAPSELDEPKILPGQSDQLYLGFLELQPPPAADQSRTPEALQQRQSAKRKA